MDEDPSSNGCDVIPNEQGFSRVFRRSKFVIGISIPVQQEHAMFFFGHFGVDWNWPASHHRGFLFLADLRDGSFHIQSNESESENLLKRVSPMWEVA